MKKETTLLRKANWDKVMDVLPTLKRRYKVVIFSHHIRVKVKGGIYYDYYPKGERIGKFKYGYWSPYRDLKVEDFISKFTD